MRNLTEKSAGRENAARLFLYGRPQIHVPRRTVRPHHPGRAGRRHRHRGFRLWPNNLYAAAGVWRDFVRSVSDSAKKLDPESYFVVRYEELCAEPEPVLEKLCEFLGEDFSPAMLAHHETASTKQWADTPVHAKTARPITTDFVEMYKHRLPKADVGVIESLIGETLREFGYALEGAPDHLSLREKRQLLENDTITNIQSIEYKRWHDGRRKDRLERGVWAQSDRNSLLWGFIREGPAFGQSLNCVLEFAYPDRSIRFVSRERPPVSAQSPPPRGRKSGSRKGGRRFASNFPQHPPAMRSRNCC